MNSQVAFKLEYNKREKGLEKERSKHVEKYMNHMDTRNGRGTI